MKVTIKAWEINYPGKKHPPDDLNHMNNSYYLFN